MVTVTPVGDEPIQMQLLFSFLSGRLRPEAVHAQTSTAWIFDDELGRSSYSGIGLSYDAQGFPVSGTITGLSWSSAAYGAFSVQGLDLSAAMFRQSLSGGDPLAVLLPGNDVYQGGARGDDMRDYAGHNVFLGGGGPDAIYGGNGNDHIWGQSPNGGPDEGDLLSGGGGSDYIQGNAGNDYIAGDDGADRLYGGQGDDAIYAGSGNDTVNGNLGDDYIGDDDGDDLLRGGQGDDAIYAGHGNDTIMGDLGADRLIGDSGADLFVFGPGTSPIGDKIDRIDDFKPGEDHLALGFMPSAVLAGSITVGGTMSDMIGAARAAAQRLFDEHVGQQEVAAIRLNGNETLLFWAGNGGGTIDSVVDLHNVGPARDYAIADFL